MQNGANGVCPLTRQFLVQASTVDSFFSAIMKIPIFFIFKNLYGIWKEGSGYREQFGSYWSLLVRLRRVGSHWDADGGLMSHSVLVKDLTRFFHNFYSVDWRQSIFLFLEYDLKDVLCLELHNPTNLTQKLFVKLRNQVSFVFSCSRLWR